MCLEGDETELKEAMEALEEKVLSVKKNALIVVPFGQQYGLFSCDDYLKAGEKTQLLRELLPFLPEQTILYFLPKFHVCSINNRGYN